MHRAGVRLVAGTDAGINPAKRHGIVAESVAGFAAGGVPPAAALASATALAAQACGLKEGKGLLRPGLDADLLVVDGDPVAEVASLSRSLAVVCRGRLVRLGPRASQATPAALATVPSPTQ